MGTLASRIAVTLSLALISRVAWAWVVPPAAAPVTASGTAAELRQLPDPAGPAAGLLRDADSAIAAGNLKLAGQLYGIIVREFPGSPQAEAARRAVAILTARAREGEGADGNAAPGAPAGAPQSAVAQLPDERPDASEKVPADVVLRQEPYSTRTSERLRLTTWEKLDFGVTSFLYGMSVGFSYALGVNPSDGQAAALPIAFGAVAYTAGAIAYLKLGNPDRGDLPLALAITSYVPTTVLLLANIGSDNPDPKKVALWVTGAGLVSAPLAIAVTQKLDLDPGDTQLVRDAGFWGLVFGTTSALGFGGSTSQVAPDYSYYQAPSSRTVAGLALGGLVGGLGLGAIAARNTEISLERVRVTTWGGYGGGVVGVILGAGIGDGREASTYRGFAIGALTGLIVTFALSGGLDGIPAESVSVSQARGPRFTPTVLSTAGSGGQISPLFGVSGLLP